jgi:polyribonucleotide nucleotidyltransferase
MGRPSAHPGNRARLPARPMAPLSPPTARPPCSPPSFGEIAQARPGLLPADRELPGKTYAAGKIPGGFFKREGRPTEKETLTSRLIDRPIRPLFPMATRTTPRSSHRAVSTISKTTPTSSRMVGASAALTCPAPLHGPDRRRPRRLHRRRIRPQPACRRDGESELDLVVAGTSDAVLMVESEAKELSEDVMLGAVMFGHKSFQPVIDAIIKLAEAAPRSRATSSPDHSELAADAGMSRADLPRPTRSPTRCATPAIDEVKAKDKGALRTGRGRRSPAGRRSHRRRLQVARGQGRPRQHPRDQEPHRRP